MERRLSAILVADVVGYSRLIRADEEGTIMALKALRADLIDPKIAEHHGRIVKLMGDGMLVEFPSVMDAVRGAGVRSHSPKRSLAGLLIAKSARRRGEIAMQTAGSGLDSTLTAIFATLPATASGHLGNPGSRKGRDDDQTGQEHQLLFFRL